VRSDRGTLAFRKYYDTLLRDSFALASAAVTPTGVGVE